MQCSVHRPPLRWLGGPWTAGRGHSHYERYLKSYMNAASACRGAQRRLLRVMLWRALCMLTTTACVGARVQRVKHICIIVLVTCFTLYSIHGTRFFIWPLEKAYAIGQPSWCRPCNLRLDGRIDTRSVSYRVEFPCFYVRCGIEALLTDLVAARGGSLLDVTLSDAAFGRDY